MDDDTPHSVGQTLKKVRLRRRLTQKAVAELAGIKPSALSMFETGARSIEKRSTLEALARVLRVSPVDLGALPIAGSAADPELSAALGGLVAVEEALSDVELFEATVKPRPWAAVHADVARMQVADAVSEVRMIPGLIRELNAVLATDPAARRPALRDLALTYRSAASVAKRLGARALPMVAGMHLCTVAEELDEPEYLGLARFGRAHTCSRPRALELSVAAADDLQPFVGTSEPARQLYGMLHLTAALASAALTDADGAAAHLREAREIARSAPDTGARGFANLSFHLTNVGVWGVMIALELGDHGRVRELRADIQPERMASRTRQGAYWADVGRSLAHDRRTRDEAVEAIMRAEELSPVATRANVWVRETVADVVARTKRDAIGSDLRGLAWRMGIAG